MTAKTTRAVRMHRHGGPEVLVVEEIPIPTPTETQVLIRVEAAGVNYADAARRRGDYYPQPMVLPHTVGGEFYGTIESAGPRVTGYQAGEAVYALHNGGAYAEYAVAEESALIPVPAGLDPVAGLALVIQGLTAAALLTDAVRVKAGDSVFVQAGASGVGLIGMQLARIYGASKVIASASSPEKRAVTLEYGADAVLDSSEEDWGEQLRAATEGNGADVILEMTGGTAFTECVNQLADFGRMAVYGVASHEGPVLGFERCIPRNIMVRGFYIGPYLSRPGFAAETIQDLASLVADGRLRLVVGGRYTLDEAREMHGLMEARKTYGKLVVVSET